MNFDAKVCRQSIEPDDMLHGHVGAMDVCARALLIAEKKILDGRVAGLVKDRYAGWQGEFGQSVLASITSLHAIAARALASNRDNLPASGRQELFENLLNEAI